MPEESGGGRLTPGELELASFWVRNRIAIRRASYGVLIAMIVLLWGYSIWGLLDAYAISYPRESRITRDIALNQQLLSSLEMDRPTDVSISDVTVLQTTDSRYDMAVDITNPNDQWYPEFSYSFSLSGEQTPSQVGYVLPHETHTLTQLGYKPKSAGGGVASLIIENVRWHRIDPTFVGADFDAFKKDRFQISFQNVAYDASIVIGSRAVSQTSFTLVNDASYGLWSVDLILRAYRGSSLVGMTQISVPKVLPGEHRPMNVVWGDILPGVTRTEITPQANLTDPGLYLPPSYFK